MRLDRFIESNLGYSAQRVRLLVAQRAVLLNSIAVDSARQQVSPFCRVEVEGKLLQARDAIYIMLHKPKGCVSATQDSKNKTVIDCIDHLHKADLHLAGRLDFNTTGLLLLTNDGAWSRRITQPTQKIGKTYLVTTKDKILPKYIKKFLEGFYFAFENITTLPAQLIILSDYTAQLTIYEGRYHQIKRMFGFFGNEVIELHRLSMGPIALDESLLVGESRLLTSGEIAGI